ncbi:MAG TPA: menaquinone biosynthesis protein [Planctomycetota bacterium]|nr:menaquinone biosynthesis protein [Planctomycetota bacterium]
MGLRIGCVSFLNARRLIEPLMLIRQQEGGLAEGIHQSEIHFAPPSVLVHQMELGKLDVALISSVAAIEHPDWTHVKGVSISCWGKVHSVKLYCRHHPARVRTLGLDPASMTANALAQIILRKRYGGRPSPVLLGFEDDPTKREDLDAYVIIGDRCLTHVPDEHVHTVLDLGEEWRKLADLPFVFALWSIRPGVELGPIEAEMQAAPRRSEHWSREIAERFGPQIGIAPDFAEEYINRVIRYTLAYEELQGLEEFKRNIFSNNIPLHTGMSSSRRFAIPETRP